MVTAESIARQVENEIHPKYKWGKSGTTANKAVLYGVSVNTETGEITVTQKSQSADVYELLFSHTARKSAKTCDFIAVATAGWASPTDPDSDDDDQVAPSQHPERRRVRLVVVASRESVASVLRFQDSPKDEPIVDNGSATGSLADAVKALFA